MRRAKVYKDLRKHNEALDDYNIAIELKPNDQLNHLYRGEIYEELKDNDKALADYDKSIELNSNSSYAYISRALVYEKLEKYEKAVADCDKAIELNSNNSYLYSIRVKIYEKLERYDEAIADCHKIIELDPVKLNTEAIKRLEKLKLKKLVKSEKSKSKLSSALSEGLSKKSEPEQIDSKVKKSTSFEKILIGLGGALTLGSGRSFFRNYKYFLKNRKAFAGIGLIGLARISGLAVGIKGYLAKQKTV